MSAPDGSRIFRCIYRAQFRPPASELPSGNRISRLVRPPTCRQNGPKRYGRTAGFPINSPCRPVKRQMDFPILSHLLAAGCLLSGSRLLVVSAPLLSPKVTVPCATTAGGSTSILTGNGNLNSRAAHHRHGGTHLNPAAKPELTASISIYKDNNHVEACHRQAFSALAKSGIVFFLFRKACGTDTVFSTST